MILGECSEGVESLCAQKSLPKEEAGAASPHQPPVACTVFNKSRCSNRVSESYDFGRVFGLTGSNLDAQKKPPEGGFFIGERVGIRTRDPLIKSQMLYRLSYAPKICCCNNEVCYNGLFWGSQ